MPVYQKHLLEPPGSMLLEKSLNVAAGMEHVDDLDRIGGVAEENDIAMRGRAAEVGMEFGARGSERPGQPGQMTAFLLEAAYETSCDLGAAASRSHVAQDIDQVVACCSEIDKSPH